MSDPQKYRTKEEMEHRQNQDPILRLKYYILNNDIADTDVLDKVDEEVSAVVLDAVEFAENSSYPPLETMYEDIYVQEDYPYIC